MGKSRKTTDTYCMYIRVHDESLNDGGLLVVVFYLVCSTLNFKFRSPVWPTHQVSAALERILRQPSHGNVARSVSLYVLFLSISPNKSSLCINVVFAIYTQNKNNMTAASSRLGFIRFFEFQPRSCAIIKSRSQTSTTPAYHYGRAVSVYLYLQRPGGATTTVVRRYPVSRAGNRYVSFGWRRWTEGCGEAAARNTIIVIRWLWRRRQRHRFVMIGSRGSSAHNNNNNNDNDNNNGDDRDGDNNTRRALKVLQEVVSARDGGCGGFSTCCVRT